MAVIKGIEDNFEDLTAIDSILFGRGQFVLHDEVVGYAIPGIELVSILGTGIKFLDPLEIYAPNGELKSIWPILLPALTLPIYIPAALFLR